MIDTSFCYFEDHILNFNCRSIKKGNPARSKTANPSWDSQLKYLRK